MRSTKPNTCKSKTATTLRPGVRRGRALHFALWLVLIPGLALATETGELNLASDTWPPFTGEAEGQRVAIELVVTALDRAGVSATTTIVDWKDVEAGIRNASFDGSAAMWRTEKREEDLLFSEPYLENRLVLVGRRGSDVAATRIVDLAGKRVAAVGRYAYGDEIKGAVGVYFINTRNDQDSLKRLLAGDVEYMLVDELVVRYLMTYQKDEVAANLEIGTTPLARRALHLTLRRDVPGAAEIIAAFNQEIRGMFTDGTYGKILQVGSILIDIDGDGLDELVTLGDVVGQAPPGTIYDVFGKEPETPPEKQRVFIRGSVYEGWDAIPDRYKGPAGPMDPTIKYGVTVFTLKF
ncbi:MAG: transporter substrate-binding domain-containing protein [Acidobacteriota bacterium]|nr:transporter substrate-binding domain-containing protein [Acidobacteriota bacterium]